MSNRNIVILDLTDCQYLGELHKRIKVALEFPDHYGENWDAFWDSLRFDSPVDYIKIIGEHTMPDDLKRHLNILHTSESKKIQNFDKIFFKNYIQIRIFVVK